MPEPDQQNLNFIWATHFVRSLYSSGISEAVISPGSRSTALTLAFAAHPGFRKHVIIDERSAAFTALGLAKASGKPAVLVCTSGTAVANYYPVVIEATQSGIPLIVASADRPPVLRGNGASQTIDQLKIFGDYPVYFHDTGLPGDDPQSVQRLQLSAKQAVHASLINHGVAHINLPFEKPFEPYTDLIAATQEENKLQQPGSVHEYALSETELEADELFWSDLTAATKPLIVCGPRISLEENNGLIQNLANVLNAPIIAEAGSLVPDSEHSIPFTDGFLKNEQTVEKLSPDLILRFGAEPVSNALNNYLKHHSSVTQIRFSSDGELRDQTQSATKHLHLYGNLRIPEIKGAANEDWINSWKNYSSEYEEFLTAQISPEIPLADGDVFSAILPDIPEDSFVMLSNSFPVRDFGLFGRSKTHEIYVNRGAAGIDGIISTTFGLSLHLQKRGFLFIGDIAFLHDSNALLNSNSITSPLHIILLNNGGGSIFRMLPVHTLGEEYFQYFDTPQDVSVAALCRAHKVDHTLISRPNQLEQIFRYTLDEPGVHVYEFITEADESMELRKKLWNSNPSN
ncbi:MAG TPA: 2-succinyl-5-enolpyruvyl-6-hydroxy-3-cyclohexene-1-carboxylic-acid synthase [Balneolaceae bacterium]|nr:2-succinyl-5-enolpyruvyl-6-hydroxy-3-cyclohexene-1-carboxylic-acid synthase [Balneolaceae bacterium]|tara:strand:+ start:105255 stop:106967 length:1713 start_codon:yes stop_codon:yes gene_type:complete